jgi:hypothetical protein
MQPIAGFTAVAINAHIPNYLEAGMINGIPHLQGLQ